MIYKVSIPGWSPTLDNMLKRHYMAVARMKRADSETIGKHAILAGIPLVALPRSVAKQRRALGIGPLQGDPVPMKRHVILEISGRFGRFPDPLAPWKCFLDALVTCGLLVDDSSEWCGFDPFPRYSRGPKGTTFFLEDLS